MRTSLKVLLAVALTIALLTASIEVLMRARVIEPSFETEQYSFVLDHRVLFKLTKDKAGLLNRQGFRDMRSFIKEKGPRKRVVFLGDSFTMGMGVMNNETAPFYLEQFLGGGYEVYNMGIRGYGAGQSLMLLLDTALDYNPDMVILGLFPANDFPELVKNRLVRIGKGGLAEYNPDNIVASEMGPLRTAYLMKFLLKKYYAKSFFLPMFEKLLADGHDWELAEDPDSPASMEKKDLMKAVLRRFKVELDKRGIPFYVVIFPSYDAMKTLPMDADFMSDLSDVFVHEELLLGICAEAGVRCIYTSRDLLFLRNRSGTMEQGINALFNNEDHHLTPFGNQNVAWVTGLRLASDGFR